MFKKTMNAYKNIILLRSIFAVLMVCTLVLCCVSPVCVSAEKWYDPIDYTQLDYTVKFGTDTNRVTVPLPLFHYYMNVCKSDKPNNIIKKANSDDTVSFDFEAGNSYVFRGYPAGSKGLLLEHIPVGSVLKFDLSVEVYYLDDGTPEPGYYMPNVVQGSYYYDDEGQCNRKTSVIKTGYTYFSPISMIYTIEDVANANSFVPYVYVQDIEFGRDCVVYLKMANARLEMDISSTYWQQWQNQQNGEKLDDISDAIGDTNDKLDGVNSNLETMPDKIGDEMQGVIDTENEKAENSGNKFVDQILDSLPDPSTEVLGALKGLTDSMAYTGTDCKLQIPALVVPGIDGLIPETEIWGGTEFSFGDYLDFLPPTLLSVVRSLFTIAIVLFCVYELKGVISYCLTLNDKKGG